MTVLLVEMNRAHYCHLTKLENCFKDIQRNNKKFHCLPGFRNTGMSPGSKSSSSRMAALAVPKIYKCSSEADTLDSYFNALWKYDL